MYNQNAKQASQRSKKGKISRSFPIHRFRVQPAGNPTSRKNTALNLMRIGSAKRSSSTLPCGVGEPRKRSEKQKSQLGEIMSFGVEMKRG